MNDIDERKRIIGARIKKERKARGWTQYGLAMKIPIKQNTISNWERGAATPSMDQLFSLASLFRCDVAYLLGDYDARNITDKWISERTGLSLVGVDWLSSAKGNDPHLIQVLNLLFQEDLLRPLLMAMYLYSFSQYSTLTEDNAVSESTIKYSLDDSRRMLKYNAQEMFSLALDHLFNLVIPTSTDIIKTRIQVMKLELLKSKAKGGDDDGKH